MVMHQSGHILNVNSEVLRRAGISRDTDVQGVVRDANGEPSGELLGPRWCPSRSARPEGTGSWTWAEGTPCGGSRTAPGVPA